MRPVKAPPARQGDAQRLHGLPPVLAPGARLLILGSFPGEASLRAGQYYAHPRNQFWPLLSSLLGLDLVAMPYDARLQLMQARGLGLWDIYASCRRQGSLDRAIVEPEFNDFAWVRRQAPGLRVVGHNGGESSRGARHLVALGFECVRLPSTSPAHASWSLDRKQTAWRALFVRCAIVAP